MSGFPGGRFRKINPTQHTRESAPTEVYSYLGPGALLTQGGIPEIVGYLCHFIFIF